LAVQRHFLKFVTVFISKYFYNKLIIKKLKSEIVNKNYRDYIENFPKVWNFRGV